VSTTIASTVKSVRAGLVQFFAAIYEPSDIIEIREIKKSEDHPRVKWTTAADLPELAESLASDNGAGWNIYAGINPRPARNQRGDEVIDLARTIFADFDDATLDDARARWVALGMPAPTLFVQSGHGVHGYCRLTNPIDDLAAWREFQWDLAVALGADVKVKNPERIMRLPGLTNWKREPVPCSIVEVAASRRADFDDLRAIVPPRPEPERPRVPQVALPSDPGNIVNRCMKYLARCPDSIEGQDGSGALYRAAMETQRFGLSVGDALAVLERFNGAKCSPPWSEKELRHKLNDARKNCNGDFGMRLREDRSQRADRNSHPQNHRQQPSTDQPTTGPVMTCLADVESRPVDWLWPQKIPRGRITLGAGRPGCGKSFVAGDISARVSTGTKWPDGAPCTVGDVLLIAPEDDAGDTHRPRLEAAGANLKRIHLMTTVRCLAEDGKPQDTMFTLEDLPSLEASLKKIRPDLVVFDPIGSLIGGGVDSQLDNKTRAVLAPVAMLLSRYNCAGLVIAHTRKATAQSADDTVMGSRGFTGIARVVWHFSRDPQNPSRRLLLPGKNNLSPEGGGLAFTIEGQPVGRVVWEPEPVKMSADDALAEQNAADGPGRPAQERQEAMEWLQNELADFSAHSVADLQRDAKVVGLSASWRTIQRASTTLKVIKQRTGFGGGFAWRLPRPGAQPPIVPQATGGESSGTNGEIVTTGETA